MLPSEYESHDHARRLAAQWPNAIMLCDGCMSSFPLVVDGTAGKTCPSCKSWDKVRVLHYGKPPEAEPAPADVEPEPARPDDRSDPPGLDDVIGNAPGVRWIRTVLTAFRSDLAKLDGRGKEAKQLPFPHTLLSGPGGTGKTMLAEIIAREICRPIKIQMGQSLTSPGRVGDILLSLKGGEVLFIDEIHGLKTVCQEALYRAMEDRIFIPVAKAGAPVVSPITLPPFTLIGSTTDEWALLPSMLQRFKVRVRLERLSAGEIALAMLERAKRKKLTLSDEAAEMIGERSHGTPRIAIAMLDGCVAVAKADGTTEIDAAIVEKTCMLLQIDRIGLDSISRKYLKFLAEGHGEPVRLNVLATRLDGLSRLTVERRIEPDLVWLGLIEKGSDGRRLTEAGLRYLAESKTD